MWRSKRALYERIIAEQREQIEWLRTQLGQPALTTMRVGGPPPTPGLTLVDGTPAVLGSPTWDSEAEEAKAILEKEGLSQVHLAEILDGLGVGSSDLS